DRPWGWTLSRKKPSDKAGTIQRVRDLGTRSHHTTHGIDDGENVRGALDSCRTGPRCASLSADDPAARAASGASRQTGARDRVETLTARRGPALASSKRVEREGVRATGCVDLQPIKA